MLTSIIASAIIALSPMVSVPNYGLECKLVPQIKQVEDHWYQAKGEKEDHEFFFYMGQFTEKHYFKGIGVEFMNPSREYGFGLGFYKTEPYTVKTADQEFTADGPINAFITNLPEAEVTEELKRQDYYGLVSMTYSVWDYTLNESWLDNLQIMYDARINMNLSILGSDEWRKYDVTVGDQTRKFQNPIERTMARGQLGMGLSQYLKLGIGRVQYDLIFQLEDLDPIYKQGKLWRERIHMVNYGAEF